MNAQTPTLADFEGILLSSALVDPAPSKAKKPDGSPKKIEFYATVAYPAEAGAGLADLAKTVAPNGQLRGLRMTIEENDRKTKPFAGIPDKAWIVRLSAFADQPPALFTEDGTRIPAGAAGVAKVREALFAGARVRVNGYPFMYAAGSDYPAGISWNLSGVMAIGGGERRGNSGESNESAFGRYAAIHDAPPAQTDAQASGFGASQNAPAATGAGGDPFNQGTASSGAAAGNPFG